MLTPELIHDREIWNSTLANFPRAHLLQSWEWGDFKRETTGWLPLRYAFKQGGVVVALASIGLRPIGPFGLMYAPKAPALRDPHDLLLWQAVIEALEKIARNYRAIWLKIDPDLNLATGVPNEEDDRPDPTGQALSVMLEARGWHASADQIQFKNSVVVDLTPSEDELLAGMSSNTRHKVRQAPKKDVTVRGATLADLPLLYELYATTSARDGFLIRPYPYYEKLWRMLMQRGLAHALIAEFEGKALAHVILFRFGQTAWYFYGASSDQERQRMPNYALQWEAMRWAKAQGCTLYDMWGAPDEFVESDPMWGVFVFKRGFRGVVERRIGAWDYTPNALLYRLYTELYPRVLTWLKRRHAPSPNRE